MLKCQWMHPARQMFFHKTFLAYIDLPRGVDVINGERGHDITKTGFVKLVRAMEEDSLKAPGTMISLKLLETCPRTRELIAGKRAGVAFAAFSKVYGKLIFLEHPVSVTGFINKVIEAADLGELTLEKFSEFLSPIRPIWIMQAENDILNKAGYKVNRPSGWMATYASLGIEVCGL